MWGEYSCEMMTGRGKATGRAMVRGDGEREGDGEGDGEASSPEFSVQKTRITVIRAIPLKKPLCRILSAGVVPRV